ncbi:Prefoldin subunit 1 [Sorochytrium milnesiophthora]
MAGVSDETMRKVLNEIQGKLMDYNRQLTTVRTQIAVKERERKLTELTVKELNSVGPQTNTYKSVGKMFIAAPQPTLLSTLGMKIDSLKDDTQVLTKKQQYLEKSVLEYQRNLQDALRAGSA